MNRPRRPLVGAAWHPVVTSALGRPVSDAGRLLQAAVAAGVAWLSADLLLGHDRPVFAAVAAVVALAADVGGRGAQALVMIVGVVAGVLAGELLLAGTGSGALQVAVAAFAAMAFVAVATDSPLALIQAGGSAAVVVGQPSPGSGGARVTDALVGGAVALLISQVLMSPDPLRVLRAPADALLGRLADALEQCAAAVDRGDADAAAAGAELTREVSVQLGSLAAVQATARRIARTTVRGRWVRGRLDLLLERLVGLPDLVAAVLLLATTIERRLVDGDRTGPQSAWAMRHLAADLRRHLVQDPSCDLWDRARAVESLARNAATQRT